MSKEAAMLSDRQMAAANYLRGEGERLQSWALAQLGSRLTADPFGKVKDMISQMVEKLLEEQAEEAEHKEWCDGEMTKTKKALTRKSDKMEDLSTRINEAMAMSAKLSNQIKTLTG